MRRTSIVLAFAFLVLGSPGVARASHYAVADVPRLVAPGEVEKLHKAGVETTAQLLEKAAKTKERKALAKSSGLPPATLLGLARRCDLLRLKGVGPEMVLLLEASGIKTTAELAKAQPAALLASATTANGAKKITDKMPTEPQIADWIGQAGKLPQVLENK